MNIDLRLGDCLEVMPTLTSESVDAIITDIPYGTTACKWDSIIPFEPMWKELKRIAKPRAAIVLFGSQPFTSALVMSNPKMFRYELNWKKNRATGFANAKKQPLRIIEDACVFSCNGHTYNPQGVRRVNRISKNSASAGGSIIRGDIVASRGKGRLRTAGAIYIQEWTKYPNNLIEFATDKAKFHPTQKPVALIEYLVKTYTNEGDTVLDFTMGSGTTGVACVNLSRNFIGIEINPNYFEIAQRRIREAQTANDLPLLQAVAPISL